MGGTIICRNLGFWSSSMVALAMLSGCMPPTTAGVRVIQAPEVAEASAYRSIAVMPFGGVTGQAFTTEVESVLAQAKVGRSAVMRVHTSEQVKHAVNSQRGGRFASPGEIGKLMGADAVISGEVLGVEVKDHPYTDQEQQCARTEKKKGLFGGTVDSCVEWRSATIHCRERIADYAVNVRLTESKTGKVVYADQIMRRINAKACKNDRLPEEAAMRGQARQEVVNRILQAIVPHESEQKIVLLSADDKLARPGSAEKFGGAMDYAKAGRSDRACEVFREIYDVEKQSPALTYNMGVCEEAEGRARDAYDYFMQADRLSGSPNKAISDALQRTNKQIGDKVALRQLRPDLLPGEPAPSAAPAKQTFAPSAKDKAKPGSGVVPDEVRYALVIGNSNYRKGALKNPVNDARDMTESLKKLGFKVIKVEDGNLAAMNLAVDEFGQKLRAGGVALFFYAGHGVQVKGENYLIPVDAELKGEEEVPYKTVNVGLVLAKLEQSSSRVNIILLDACRDNPFTRSMRSLRSGLASIDAPAGSIIAYATAPGKTAADGLGRNGLYTSHLLQQMAVPGVKLEDVFKQVRAGVTRDSRNVQVPWETSSLTGDFYFSMAK